MLAFSSFSVRSIIEAFETSCPQLMAPIGKSVDEGLHDLGFLRLHPDAWSQAEDISIDYAVMEKADNLSVVPFSAGWSDLGGWDAVWRESEQDDSNVATSGPATAIECQNTLLRSENDSLELVGIGLDNVMAVAMPDAVLVADMSRAQDVKKAVSALKKRRLVRRRPSRWITGLGAGLKPSCWMIAFR